MNAGSQSQQALLGFVLVCITFVVACSKLSLWAGIILTLAFAVSLVIAQIACGVLVLKRLTIGGFWYWTYLVMIFLPALFVYSEQEGPYRNRFLIAVVMTLFTVPLGWVLANMWSGYSLRETEKFFSAPLQNDVSYDRLRKPITWLLAVASCLTITYILEVKTIPLFYLFAHPGDYLELVFLREESFKLLDSPLIYVYFMLRSVLFPFIVALSLGCYLRTRERWWMFCFVVSSLLGVFFASLSLAKAPVAIIIFVAGFFVYLYRGGTLSRKTIACLLILTLAFPIFVVLGVSDDSVTGSMVALGVVTRIFYLPAEVVYFYFEVFPTQQHYLHGLSIDKLARIVGEHGFPTENFVGTYAYPQYQDTVSANGAFFAYLYADFGMTGVLVGGIIVGIVMQAVSIWLIRRRKNVVTLAGYAFMLYAFWFLHSVAFPVVIASNGVVAIMLLVTVFSRKSSYDRRQLLEVSST